MLSRLKRFSLLFVMGVGMNLWPGEVVPHSQTDLMPIPKALWDFLDGVVHMQSTKPSRSAIAPLLSSHVILWTMPGGAYWPHAFIPKQPTAAQLKAVAHFVSSIREGPIHFPEPQDFWADTCGEGKNPFEGHWALQVGDEIRQFATMGLEEVENLPYCKKQAQDPRACTEANRHRAQYTLIFQGDTTTVKFGVRKEKGQFSISDIAVSDQCDL